MNNNQPTNRALKRELRSCLGRDDFVAALHGLSERYPGRRLINPLLSFLYDQAALTKWRAVTGVGVVVAHLADHDLEAARVIMRRLMWSLNDESGGIGWGAAESMGEIMARHERLTEEFNAILISYISPGKNNLEHEGLQAGALWGVGRLARADNPATRAMVKHVGGLLPPYLGSADPMVRGHAVWAALSLNDQCLRDRLKTLAFDPARVMIYQNEQLTEVVIGEMITAETNQGGT